MPDVRRALAAVTACACGLGLAACSPPSAEPSYGPAGGDITVFAAASLHQTFTELGKRFEAANPGSTVTFSFQGSSRLAASIVAGAPADVFASASPANMDQVVAAGDALGPVNFVQNSMEIAVPPANPGQVAGLSDLANPAVKTVTCQDAVPCGATALKIFSNAGLMVTPVSKEPDVNAVLTKIKLNEADAGMVYRTDVLAAGSEVEGIAIPADQNATTAYPISALTRSTNTLTAAKFVEFVLSPAAAAVFDAAGFARP